MLDMLFYLVAAAGALAILVRINATIALFVFVPLAAVVGVAQALTTRLRRARAASQNATSRVTGALSEIFGAVQAVQLARAERAVVEHFRAISEVRRQAVLQEQKVVLLGQSVQLNVVSLGTGLILLLGAQAIRDRTFTVGDFALFVSYLGFVTDSTTFAGFFLTQVKQLGISVQRMLALIGAGTSATQPAALVELRRGISEQVEVTGPSASPLRELSVVDLSYAFPSGHAGIADISFAVQQGSFTVVTGRVGAGKTTLLKTISGLLRPTAGSGRVAGFDLRQAPGAARARLGYMAQKFSLYEDLSARQNLDFFSSVYGLAGRRQCHGLGMGTAADLGPAAADHMAFRRDNHTADRRIGRNTAKAARSQRQRMAHVPEIIGCGGFDRMGHGL